MKTKSVSLITDIQGNHKEQIMEQKISHKLLNTINITLQVYLLVANWLPKNHLPFFAVKSYFDCLWLSFNSLRSGYIGVRMQVNGPYNLYSQWVILA